MKYIIQFLFYVVGPTIALLATTHGNDFLKKEFSLQWNTFILVSYFVIACAYFIFDSLIQKKKRLDEKIKSLEKEKDNYKYELQHHGNSFWRELKYLSKYKENEVLYSIVEKFTKLNDCIVGIQIYNYQIITGSLVKNETTIKINHTVGYVTEGENQNAILQSYFMIKTTTLEFFLKARKMIRLGYSKPIIVFARRYMRQLENKTLKDLSKRDVFVFSLLILALEELEVNNDLKITKHEEELHKIQKNGILRGIMDEGEFYQFVYKNNKITNNEKHNRHYLTKKLLINGRRCIVVMTMEYNNNNVEFENLGKEFMELLVASDLTVEY